MQDEGLRLLETLTQAHSVPGYEEEVREIFIKELREHGELEADHCGSICCKKPARQSDGPRVMVAGHMDEVGFRVQAILSNGFLKMVPVGGWWGHTLLSQRVEVKTASGGKIMGTVCSKPPHFLTEGERNKVIAVTSMFIDISARSKEEAEEWGVALGDPVAPWSPWQPMKQENWFMTKAFDNRVGMAGAIQVGQNAKDLPCELYVAGSVQEEVGGRFATSLSSRRPSSLRVTFSFFPLSAVSFPPPAAHWRTSV